MAGSISTNLALRLLIIKPAIRVKVIHLWLFGIFSYITGISGLTASAGGIFTGAGWESDRVVPEIELPIISTIT